MSQSKFLKSFKSLKHDLEKKCFIPVSNFDLKMRKTSDYKNHG